MSNNQGDKNDREEKEQKKKEEKLKSDKRKRDDEVKFAAMYQPENTKRTNLFDDTYMEQYANECGFSTLQAATYPQPLRPPPKPPSFSQQQIQSRTTFDTCHNPSAPPKLESSELIAPKLLDQFDPSPDRGSSSTKSEDLKTNLDLLDQIRKMQPKLTTQEELKEPERQKSQEKKPEVEINFNSLFKDYPVTHIREQFHKPTLQESIQLQRSRLFVYKDKNTILDMVQSADKIHADLNRLNDAIIGNKIKERSSLIVNENEKKMSKHPTYEQDAQKILAQFLKEEVPCTLPAIYTYLCETVLDGDTFQLALSTAQYQARVENSHHLVQEYLQQISFYFTSITTECHANVASIGQILSFFTPVRMRLDRDRLDPFKAKQNAAIPRLLEFMFTFIVFQMKSYIKQDVEVVDDAHIVMYYAILGIQYAKKIRKKNQSNEDLDSKQK